MAKFIKAPRREFKPIGSASTSLTLGKKGAVGTTIRSKLDQASRARRASSANVCALMNASVALKPAARDKICVMIGKMPLGF